MKKIGTTLVQNDYALFVFFAGVSASGNKVRLSFTLNGKIDLKNIKDLV